MPNTKIKVVTGYTPIADYPRSVEDFGALGEKLRELKYPVHPFYGTVTSTWLFYMISALPFSPVWSVGTDPLKNTLAFHCVQYEKYNLLYQALRADENSDVFVWLDYAICHLPGVTPGIINEFLSRVKAGKSAIPGHWPLGPVNDQVPCQRFYDGLLVLDRRDVEPLKNLVQAVTMLHVNVTKNITWAANTLARAEQTEKVPLRWYDAGRDQTMFTGY